MTKKTIPHRETIDLIQANGYSTAHMLAKQDDYRRIIAAAEHEHLVRQSGLVAERTGIMTWTCSTLFMIGESLIRTGSWLQHFAVGRHTFRASRTLMDGQMSGLRSGESVRVAQ